MAENEAKSGTTLATLTPDEAKAAIQFLNRADIKGNESEAHAHVKFKLGLIANGQPMPQPANVTSFEGATGKGKI